METKKRIRPVYFHLIGSLLACIATTFDKAPVLQYSFLALGMGFALYAIVRYFRD
jgi:hypothetical protein